MTNFIIFASARTGSTSLADVLGKSKDVKLCFEPFNENFTKWNPNEKNYLSLIKDKRTFIKVIDKLFSKYTALKVLDYQLPANLYKELLSNRDIKILFLRRRNLLAMAISDLVAHQVKEWRKTKKVAIYNNLKPLDIHKIEDKIKYVSGLNNIYSEFLDKERKNDFLPLFYEDLYSEISEVNMEKIKYICDYLKISLPPRRVIGKYMNPKISKINYNNIYRNIPNIKEIEEFFTEDYKLTE